MHDEQAKAETIDKVISIVRKQLALPADTKVSPESTFTKDLGADSLDTVSSVGFRIFIKTIQHLVTIRTFKYNNFNLIYTVRE